RIGRKTNHRIGHSCGGIRSETTPERLDHAPFDDTGAEPAETG
ncbi:MAG: hypothetical protein RJA70_3906, partial [Pseudomonadota bacterium]